MSKSNLATEVETGLSETQNQRDVRVEELWVKLDPNRTGELDFRGLQRGFKKLDHRESSYTVGRFVTDQRRLLIPSYSHEECR